MSKYHVLGQSADERLIEIGLHYDVPEVLTNEVGHKWRDIIPKMESRGPTGMTMRDPVQGFVVSRITYIDDAIFNPEHATEPAAIASGAILEIIRDYRFSKLGLSTAQKKTEIEAFWDMVQSEVVAQLTIAIEYFGYSND